jgi:hypothetical protein
LPDPPRRPVSSPPASERNRNAGWRSRRADAGLPGDRRRAVEAPGGRRRDRSRIVTGRGTGAPSAPVRTIQVRRSSVSPRLCTLLVCTLLVAGCADPDGAPPGGTSEGPGAAGDALALQPVLEGSSALRLATAPTLVLGDDSGRAGHAFGRVVGAVLLPDGGIAVLDQMSSVLSFFAPDGAWLASVGGPGDGPGEFRRPLALRLAPDGSLEAEDLSGLMRFAADGTVLGTERTDHAGLSARVPGRQFSRDCHVIPAFAGSWRLMVPCDRTPPPDETGPHPMTSAVLRFDDRWEEPTLIAEPVRSISWRFRYRSATGFGRVWAPVPFYPRGLFALGSTPPRRVHARTDRYGFEVIDLESGAEAVRIERRIAASRRTPSTRLSNGQPGSHGPTWFAGSVECRGGRRSISSSTN